MAAAVHVLQIDCNETFDHFTLLFRTAMKCTKNYNARAQSLLCSLNLLFIEVPVAAASWFS